MKLPSSEGRQTTKNKLINIIILGYIKCHKENSKDWKRVMASLCVWGSE
jgi:hypothetical protein